MYKRKEVRLAEKFVERVKHKIANGKPLSKIEAEEALNHMRVLAEMCPELEDASKVGR
jgi:hypothetical protein